MTSNESIGKRESILPHDHRRAHLDHQGSPVLGERHEIGHGEVGRHNRWQYWSPVRTALERHGIGWTTWDYSGGFGVVTKSSGAAAPDPVTLGAIGLKP
jgi:hypothetical protein